MPRWRDSDVYDDRERAVLEYAEVASSTPAAPSEELMERLHSHFSDARSWNSPRVAFENYRSRQRGLGLRSQGFSTRPPGARGGELTGALAGVAGRHRANRL